MSQLIRATIHLTPAQIELLAPIAEAITAAGTGGVLGQAYVLESHHKHGVAEFIFMPEDAFQIVSAALLEAREVMRK